MQNRFVLLVQTWCLYTWSYLHILIIIRFSINCSTVIHSHTIIYAILREATSETYGPRVYFRSYKFPIYFILQSLLSTSVIKIPKIFILLLLSISDLTLASGHEGIDNPFYRVGCEVLICLCRYKVTRMWSPTGLIPWFSKQKEILTLLCCITLSSSRENQCRLKT